MVSCEPCNITIKGDVDMWRELDHELNPLLCFMKGLIVILVLSNCYYGPHGPEPIDSMNPTLVSLLLITSENPSEFPSTNPAMSKLVTAKLLTRKRYFHFESVHTHI